MRASMPRAKSCRRPILVGLGAAMLVFAANACGGGTPDALDISEIATQPPPRQSDARVVPSDRVLTIDHFKAAGVKHGKDYDVEGLPGATAAVLAFHDRKDVEIRFFPSHDVAVSEGIPVAEEIVGEDVYIKHGEVTWSGAIPDERACAPGNLGGGRDCTRQPKYGSFVVYGNCIMFCEGKDSGDALQRCRAILELLDGTSAASSD